MKPEIYTGIIAKALRQSVSDNLPRLGAAFAFYSLLSSGPLLLFLVTLIGFFFGSEHARDTIINTSSHFLDRQSMDVIFVILAPHPAPEEKTVFLVVIMNIFLLLFGSLSAFNELQEAFNIIWKVKVPAGRTLFRIIQERLFSFLIVFIIGLLFLLSLATSTALAAMTKYATGIFPATAVIMQIINLGTGFLLTLLLFAWMYKEIPDAKVHWRDVWFGAFIASLLFTVGQWAIGYYLGHSSIASRFGAAGSLVALLVWVYYTIQIIFAGAEISHAYACCTGPYCTEKKSAVSP